MSKQEDRYHQEEDFLEADRKQHRKERKRIQLKDRSKYKKSDQDQLLKVEKPLKQDHWQKARVIRILPEGFLVDCEDQQHLCSLKGSLKKIKSLDKNLLSVGDFVHFETKGKDHVICEILPRYSTLSRADNLSRKKRQIIAANIDLVFITASVVSPTLKLPLLDRYIISAKKGNLKPVILINKVDLLETSSESSVPTEKILLQEILEIYPKLGISVIALSTHTGEGLEALKALMQGKTSVFSGQSGVGKTSLINMLTNRQDVVGGIVERTQKGSHTTSNASLIPLVCGGFCVDTPGIRSFGIFDLDERELTSYFEEILKASQKCQYPNCQHIHEPNCNVHKLVKKGKISSLRFDSYCSLMASCKEEHRNR